VKIFNLKLKSSIIAFYWARIGVVEQKFEKMIFL